MNKQTRNRLRELAGKAKNEFYQSAYHKHGLTIWENVDWGYHLNMGGFDNWGGISDLLASISPDVLIQLLDKLDKADELAKTIEILVANKNTAKTSILQSLEVELKLYRKAGESEGDDDG